VADTISAVAPLVAGFLAVIGLVAAKENKTSEFRQKWIDELRNDVSDFLSNLAYSRIHHDNETGKLANAARCKIKLRLNLEEEPSKVLHDASLRLIQLAMNSRTDEAAVKAGYEDLLDKTAVVLKNEWKRVKRGELRYRLSLWFALVMLSVSAISVVWRYIAK